jgi:hypothetical protein
MDGERDSLLNIIGIGESAQPTDIARDEQQAERRRIVDAMREPFRDVRPEEIERETAKAVAEKTSSSLLSSSSTRFRRKAN